MWTATAIASLLLLIILSRKRKVVRSSTRRNTANRTRAARTQTRTKNNSRRTRVVKAETRSHSSRTSQNLRNTRTTRTAGKHSKGKHCGKGFKFFSIVLAIAIIFPTVSRAVSNSSLVVTFDTNFKFRDKLIVEYDANNGTKQKVIKYNELIGELEEPTKAGYEFEEWLLEDGTPFNPEEPITDDVKLIAKFKTLTYTISYDLKEGSLEEGKTNPIEYTIESNNIQLNNPTKEAYTFAGWTGTELNGIVENVTIAKGSTGNREYTANWTTSDYTITYNLNGGTATGNPSTYTIESNDINLNKPTKFGYTFTGWTGTDLADKTEDVTIVKGSKGNREYTATWTPTVYTITYQGLTQEEETALNNPTEYTIETQAITLNNPQDRRDGDNDLTERFVGWRENVSITTNYNIPGELGDKIIEAVWVVADPNVYTVTYNLNGGTVSTENRTSFTKFDTFTLNNPTKTGYDFDGWTGSNGTTPEKTVTVPTGIREDLNYTANWTPSNYTIITKHDDGTEISRIQYTIVSEPVILETPTKTGYTFTGWTGTDLTEKTMDVTIPTGSIGNREYTENWQANTYAIVFDRNTGSGSMRNQTMTYDVEANLNANEFTKTGYTFAGWNTKADGQGTHYRDGQPVSNLASEQGAEVTLYAEWTPNTYTIVFNKNDDAATGTMANQPMTYDTAANLTLNEFEKTNYTFVRWNTQADGQGVIYRDGDEVTNLATEEGATVNLYAEWEGNAYKVIFDKNNSNATGTMEPQEFNYDVEQNLTANGFSYLGYKFMGWTLNPNGTGTVYTDEQAVKNLSTGADVTLYAKWREIDAIFNVGNETLTNTLNNIINENPDAVIFKKYEGTPDNSIIENATNVSSTIDAIWVWPDGENIYFWSEDNTPSFTSMNSAFDRTKLREIYLDGIDATRVQSMYWAFANSTTLKIVDFGDNFDTSNNKSLNATFGNATNLERIYFGDSFSTENVNDMQWLFNSTSKLKEADVSSFNMEKVQSISTMFVGCGLEELDLRSWDTKALKGSLYSTFASNKIKKIQFSNKFDTSRITNMTNAFAGIQVTSLDLSMFDTSKVTSMQSMFSGVNQLTSLNLESFSSESLTNMASMFSGMTNLEEIVFGNDFTASNVTNMSNTFYNTSSLTSLDLSAWNVANVTNMDSTFMGMNKLTLLDLTGWSFNSVTNVHWTFANNPSLKTIYVSDPFLSGNYTSYTDTFGNTTTRRYLYGGAGTYCTSTNYVYARIDDPDNGKPGYFSIKGAQYIRYDGNGADNAEYETMTSHYLTNTGSLKANAFVRDGYTFAGWNTEADGSGTSYTDEQLMSDLVESKTPLTLYAQWE